MIPARLESSRLPRKALVDIAGLPMIVHTCKRARLAESLDRVYLATDSDEIRAQAEAHGIDVVMTGSHHTTGTDRLAEAARGVPADVIVNIQGDEPLVNPAHIDAIVAALRDDAAVNVALGVSEFTTRQSPSDIKAVLDLEGNVMYCSRTDLPSDVRRQVESPVVGHGGPALLKMCFLVAFRREFLFQFAAWPPTPLERIEFNEYLRILEHGEKLRAVKLANASISVDTPEDLERVRALMADDELRHTYMNPATATA